MISLQNGFRLYFGFKTCPASDLTPLHTLYKVTELAPLLQEIFFLIGTCHKAVFITFAGIYWYSYLILSIFPNRGHGWLKAITIQDTYSLTKLQYI